MEKAVVINTMGYGVQVWKPRPLPENPPKFQNRYTGVWYYYLYPEPILPDKYGKFAMVLPDGSIDKYHIESHVYSSFIDFEELSI